jgi:LAO/AO transport system kinase
MSLAQSVLEGSRLALARVLTQVENDTPQGRAALNDLFPHTGHAHLIGVTGAPGTGKSSLVNQLALHYRRPLEGAPRKVAIVAIDPSSPFTGGAILGDRVRMRDLAYDPGVLFVDGLTWIIGQRSTSGVAVLDAAGFDIILSKLWAPGRPGGYSPGAYHAVTGAGLAMTSRRSKLAF